MGDRIDKFAIGDRVIQRTGWRRGVVIGLNMQPSLPRTSKIKVRWDRENREGERDVWAYCCWMKLESSPLTKWHWKHLKGQKQEKRIMEQKMAPAIAWAALGGNVDFKRPVVISPKREG